jgi:hypothetical protein
LIGLKSFLNSKALTLILKDKESDATVTFIVPQKCLVQEKVGCGADKVVEEVVQEIDQISTPTKQIIVEKPI